MADATSANNNQLRSQIMKSKPLNHLLLQQPEKDPCLRFTPTAWAKLLSGLAMPAMPKSVGSDCPSPRIFYL